MTGGTALPADVNPPPPLGASDQPSRTGQPGASGQPPGQQPAGKLPGLPRLFFADNELDPQASGQPGAGSAVQGEPGQGQPVQGEPGQGQPVQGQPVQDQPVQDQPGQDQPVKPSRYGAPVQPSRLAFRGDRQGQWQAGQGLAPGQARQGSSAGRPGPGPGRPARAGRTKPPERELRQRGMATLIFGVMSLVAILFGIGPDPRRGVYLVIFSSLVGIAAIVIGVSAIVKARKTGSYRPRGVIGGIGLGVLATVFSLMFGVLYLAFPSQMRTYVNCIDQAQTTSQKQACLNQLEKSIRAGLPSRGGQGQGGTTQGSVDGPRRAGLPSS